jgi:hypothetical protein
MEILFVVGLVQGDAKKQEMSGSVDDLIIWDKWAVVSNHH